MEDLHISVATGQLNCSFNSLSCGSLSLRALNARAASSPYGTLGFARSRPCFVGRCRPPGASSCDASLLRHPPVTSWTPSSRMRREAQKAPPRPALPIHWHVGMMCQIQLGMRIQMCDAVRRFQEKGETGLPVPVHNHGTIGESNLWTPAPSCSLEVPPPHPFLDICSPLSAPHSLAFTTFVWRTGDGVFTRARVRPPWA